MSDDLCKECSKRLEIRRNKKGSAYVACGNVTCGKYKPSTPYVAPEATAKKGFNPESWGKGRKSKPTEEKPIATPQPDQPRKRGFFALT